MNILILEDERAAAGQLAKMITRLEPTATIAATIETVREANAWLSSHPQPDLVISDIQLADGISLDVFAQVQINAPVIFITAYDAYTLKAFKLNSIDYLLKPIDEEELKAAFNKYHTLRNRAVAINNQHIYEFIAQANNKYRTRFVVKYKDDLRIVPVERVSRLQADDRIVFLHTATGERYIIDESLDELEKLLDPHLFFRINRRYITPLASIERISNYFNGRLKITLKNCADNDIYVSRDKAPVFKKWLDG